MTKPKLYLYDKDKLKVLEVCRDDPRLLFGHPAAPDGKIVVFKYRDHGPVAPSFRLRTRARDKWRYLYYGETRDELARRVNAPILRDIGEIVTQIALLKSRADGLRAGLLPVVEDLKETT